MMKSICSIVVAISTLWGGQQLVSAQAQDHAAIMEKMRAQEEHIDIWQRHPFVGIPLISTPPTIDGKVESQEWTSSARISRLIDFNKGLIVKDRTDYFLSYTPTHLYIAFQFERPDSSRLPSERDFTEIMLDISHGHEKFRNGAFGLGKILWTGVAPNLQRSAWQPDLEYKSRATDFGWEGEIAIPFKEFGLDAAPAAGTIWGADFLRNEKTPVDRMAIWSYRGKNWHAVKNMGHLLFMGKPVAIRAEGIGWLPEQQQAGVKVLVSNFGTEPVTINSTMELRKASGPIQMEYYPRIDSAMSEQLTAAIGSTLQKEVTTALSEYPVLKEETEVVTVAPGSSKQIELLEPDAPGKYLAGFAIREGGRLLAGSLIPVDINVRLAIKTNSFLYSAKTVEYEVDLRRMKEVMADNSSLHLIVKDPRGRVVAQDKQPIDRSATEVAGIVRFEPMPNTTLMVHANIVNGDKVVAQNKQHLHVPPKPPWLNNNIGKKKFVPEPFKPVQVSAREVKASTSVYNWSNNSFLPSFKVNNHEVLAAPITLSFKDKNGALLPLKLNSWKLKSKDIEHASYTFSGHIADKATVHGAVSVEFDGLSWYRLKITPRAPLELSASALDISLKKEFARLATAYGPEGGGMFSGRVPAEALRFAFSHSFWLGNVEGGVQWFAENPKHWSNANPKDVIQISADDKAGHLKINFIDKPTTLDKPIEWSFGFIPTPSRVKAKEWGKFGFFQTGFLGPSLNEPMADQSAPRPEDKNRWRYFNSPAWQRDKKNVYGFIHHDGWQELMGYPGTYERKRQQQLKWSADTLHKEGIKTLVYAGWGMNTAAPEWRDYGMEMVRLPLYNSGYGTYRQDNTTMWSDWYIYKVAEMIREYDIDGLFLDSVTSPMISENYTPGMRWTDETGKVRGSFPILATREWMKRLYKMFHGELKPNGVIYNHNSPPAIMAIETFIDVRCPSEYAQAHQGELDQEFIDMFLAKNSGEPFGLYSELTNKDWMGQWAAKKSPQVYAVALPLNISFKALSSVFAMPYTGNGSYAIHIGNNQVNQMMPWIWEANRWVDKSTAEYLPWWENAKYISTSPSDDRVIHALWLQKGKKALVCVSNLENEARQIDVALNLAELGMKNITVEDAITGEVVPTTGGKTSLNIDFERFRLLKVTAK